MAKFTIALANARVGKTSDESLSIALEMIADASRNGADLIGFPESYVPGYRCGNASVAAGAELVDAAWAAIDRAAAEHKMVVILGTERHDGEKIMISARVTGPDGNCMGFQDKVQLDPSEEAVYSSGVDRRTFRYGEVTFGIVICHEGWRYPETVRAAARMGAQIVFHPHTEIVEDPTFVPSGYGDPNSSFHEKAVLCRAAENHCFFATVNNALAGATTTSAVADPEGKLVAFQPYGEHGLLIVEIDPNDATGFLAQRLKT